VGGIFLPLKNYLILVHEKRQADRLSQKHIENMLENILAHHEDK